MSMTPSRTVLFVAANPKGTSRLRLDEEVKKVEHALERSKKRDDFRLIQKWAVTADDLRRALLDHQPEIVHFSGHGAGTNGLVFEADNGTSQPISGDSLAELFRLCAADVKCVVLNACMSEVQAKTISSHINYVIGMSHEIGDEAAIKFAIGFYDALGAGKDCEQSYHFGCNAIDLRSIPERLTPVFMDGVRPRHFVQNDVHVQAPDDYAELSLLVANESTRVLFRPTAFRSISALLDELFIHYLANHVAPFSYGSQWVLTSGWFNSRIAAPLKWVNEQLPIHKIDVHWASQPPAQVGLVPRSSWELLRLDKKHGLIERGVIGIATHSDEMAAALTDKAKLYSLFVSEGYLVPTEIADVLKSEYEHQLVFRDWLSVAKRSGHMLVDTGKPLTPDLRNIMEDMR